MSATLLTLDATGRSLIQSELVAARRLRLRCLAGATAIHLAASDGEKPTLRYEIPAESGEVLEVTVDLVDGQPALSTPGRPVLALAPDARYGPASPLAPSRHGAPLDLAVLVDGTLLDATASGCLLANAEAWRSVVERLTAFIGALVTDSGDLRGAVVAFADETPPHARALDLIPGYVVHPPPSAVRLRSATPPALAELLLAIEPSSGGDYVDALADGLAASAELHWRPEARKVLLVIGDSPGFSLLEPAPHGADAVVREHELEDGALTLHERGVIVTTIFATPESTEGELASERALATFAADQYRRLASRRDLAFELSTFDPRAAAEALLAETGALGRGPSWGALVEVE